MLAQNFKTATELKISEEEQAALIKVLGMLERGELVDAPSCFYITHNGFNMNCQGEGCGTAACIGGWVATIIGVRQKTYVNSYRPFDSMITRVRVKNNCKLSDLYWSQTSAKVAEAAIALRNYLTTGDAQWHLAMEKQNA
jgi:hypothetical protein